MSKFNERSVGTTKTTNLAGGEAYKQTPELELVSLLLTSFVNDSFYQSANQQLEILKHLIAKCDKKFVAQAAIYARTQFGMRSISHVVGSELGKYVSGTDWATKFYNKMVYRPDDMMETIAYHIKNNGKIPNAMKKGFASAFDRFDAYSLAKYKGEGKGVKLIDVVNLVHPIPLESNKEALAALVKGELKSFDTWESKMSEAGQKGSNEAEKLSLKKGAWEELIRNRKLGYFALLRNLRNIVEQAPGIVDEALKILTNEALIKKSLVLPFRFTTAYEELSKVNAGPVGRKVLMAINQALDISVNNVPKFEGNTLVALDVSGSMSGKPSQIGSLFAAILIKSNNADFIKFADNAKYVNVNPMDSTTTIASSIRFSSGGTNFRDIFKEADKPYDRIIILSDMQAWVGSHTPVADFERYKKSTNSNPYIYSFDLNGLGSMQFPQTKTFCLAGFSDKIFSIMEMLEQDKNALLNTIKKVEF